jgi:uncharacterized membrane protein (DUF4010 family)
MVDLIAEPLSSTMVRLAIAFGIGALVGLEREQAESAGAFAGSRTFPLFALLGALVQAYFPVLLPVVVIGIALALVVAYAGKIWLHGDVGLTTVTAALLTVVLGALTTHSEGALVVAIVVGGVVTVLLTAKQPIHAFADRIEDSERRASTKFILVVLVVLPVLPDRELDVLFGLNLRFVWLMVVFVTGLSFVAYGLSRMVGARRGIALTGTLGGFVSSTATTVSMAERASQMPSLHRICAFGTVLASIVMFPRALVEVAVINRSLLSVVAPPLLAMTAVGAVLSAALFWWATHEEPIEADIENPFRLGPAILFGAVFAVVLLVSESAHAQLGTSGVYVTAFLSGLADVDAITITLSTLAAEDAIAPGVAATGIVIGAIANTLVKIGLATVLGTWLLGRDVVAALGVVSVVGLAVVVLL